MRSMSRLFMSGMVVFSLSACGSQNAATSQTKDEGGGDRSLQEGGFTFGDPTVQEIQTSSEIADKLSRGENVALDYEELSQEATLTLFQQHQNDGGTVVVRNDPAPAPTEPANQQDKVALMLAEGDTLGTIERIIAIGEKAYQIIRDNRAVAEITTRSVAALPEGSNLSNTANCSTPEYRSYALAVSNLFRIETVRLEYTVSYQYACSVNGRGRYLVGVRVHPTHVKVLWGYTLNFALDDAVVTNIGSADAPTAHIQLFTTARISTLLKVGSQGRIFSINGASGTLSAR